MRLQTRARYLDRLLLSVAALATIGCTDGSPPPPRPAVADDTEAERELSTALSKLINEASIRNAPLVYDYDEDLLVRIDQVEAYLAGGAEGKPPRFMPKLTEAEEADHFRETIRLWEAGTGRKLRPEIDQLKAEVAARKPDGPRYYPDFHKRFSATFDEFIKIEVADTQRRRNREIHAQVVPLLETYGSRAPELVRTSSEMLNQQYPLPSEPETRAH